MYLPSSVLRDHLDHVEPHPGIGIGTVLQVLGGRCNEPPLFGRADCFGRQDGPRTAAGLDLRKDDGIIFVQNQVQLPHACPEIVIEQQIPFLDIVLGGNRLAGLPQRPVQCQYPCFFRKLRR